MGSFNEQMDENGGYYTEMLEMERRRKEEIERHRQQIKEEGYSKFYPNEMVSAQKIIERRKRNAQAQHRRNMIEEQEYKKKYFGLYKQQFLKKRNDG